VGNKIEQTDPNGNMTIWDYDNAGRFIAHTLPLGMYETFTYDPNGNMLTKTDFNGNTTAYEYSVCCGRLMREIYEDNSEVAFTYTGTGQRDTVTDARGTASYIYNERDRLLSVNNPDGTILTYEYDPAGNRTSVTAPSGATAYAYDALNRLISVIDPDGGVTSYSYDNAGNRTGITYPNGNITEYEYDTLNRLTYLENRKSDGVIISCFTYTLGASGNRTRVLENTGRIVNYTYDDAYRLVMENINDLIHGSETIAYTYDVFGNRLTKTDSKGTVVYTYDDNDRLILEDGPGYTNDYTYDANGNTIDKSDGTVTTDYTYDYENRLIQVDNGTANTSYVYDQDGIRVSSNTNGTIANYVVDKNRDYAQVMEEKDGSGAMTVEYVYGDDLISQERGGTDSYYLYDGHGSTRQLTNSTEATTDTYIYDAFGIELNRTGTTENNYLYTGEQYDPNAGFYYLRARYMNPQVGRFVTTDPFEGRSFEPATLHRYLYTANNPVNMIDPSGRFTLSEVLTTIDVAMTLHSIYSGSMALYRGEYKEATVEFTYVAFWGAAGSRKILKFGTWWNNCRKVRVIYNSALRAIEDTVSIMQGTGKSVKEIAEAVVKIRNEAKVSARALQNADDVAKIEARNLKKYGDAIGPTLEQLYLEYGSYEVIIEKSMESNFWINLLFLSF
jgi:RHS repeat-associated protein